MNPAGAQVPHGTVCASALADCCHSAAEMTFRGKTALVTGASSGIGGCCARLLAREGAQLLLVGRRAGALEAVARECGKARVLAADLADPASLSEFCDDVLAATGSLDIVVHCAGVGIRAPADATDPGQARRLIAVNLLAPVEITRRLKPAMAPNSTIVMVSSVAGKVALPGMAVYSASKHALNAYADALRAELRGSGVRVLCACPGFVRTPFGRNMLQGSTKVPLPGSERLAISPEQCAAAIVDAARKGRRTVVVPRHGWLLVAFERALPTAARAWMLRMAHVGKAA